MPAADLHERAGDLLELIGRHEEARDEYGRAAASPREDGSGRGRGSAGRSPRRMRVNAIGKSLLAIMRKRKRRWARLEFFLARIGRS